MNSPTDFNNKSVVVLGAGVEGIDAAAFLYATFPNARIQIADKQERTCTIPNIKTLFGANYPTSLREWDIVVVSPGVEPNEPLLATAQYMTTATNIFFERCKGTIIGVTGSKGKSTTSALIHTILTQAGHSSHLVGNIGTPALGTLREQNTPDDIFVYELSSYQTRLLQRGPDIAVITSLFPDHMSYHGSVEQYYADKLRITSTQTPEQHLCFNAANNELNARVAHSPATPHPWPSEQGAHIQNNRITIGGQEVLSVNDLPLVGEHNVSNVLGAVTATTLLGCTTEHIRSALKSFKPLPYRLEPIATVNGVTFINDSLSTTPESTMAAIHAMPNTGTLLLGGEDRGYDFTALGHLIAEKKIPNVILFPHTGNAIEQAIRAAGHTPNILHTSSMKEAVAFAALHGAPGTTCVLSCASPSFSVFKDYKDRGDQFRAAINNL